MGDWLRTCYSRLRAALGRDALDDDFSAELASHLAMLTEEHQRRGMPADEARRAALVELGGLTQLSEAHREQRGLPVVERIAQDLRYAVRMFVRAPGFTLFAGAALALGIGATAAVFSLVDRTLLRPFPYADPSRLVLVWEDDSAYGFPRNDGSPFGFTTWRERNRVFEDMAALRHDSANLTGGGTPEYLHADTVTPNFFTVLGVAPTAGQVFVEADGVPGSRPTVVLSHGLWTRRFGADPGVIGRDIILDGAPHTVVGVMPRGFQFLDPRTDVWVPAQWTPAFIEQNKDDHWLMIVGRLKRGIGIARARADMDALGSQLTAAHIWEHKPVLVPLRQQVAGDARPRILMLAAAVAFVLLIACANVAGLLLARASARRREVGLRLALGAGPRRIVEQMLTESLLLSLVAGAAGLAVAAWSAPLLVLLIPKGIVSTVDVDGRVLAFTAAVSIATAVLFGVLPAIRASRFDLSGSLRQGGARSGAGGHALRRSLVVAEIALAMVLMTGAALLVRSFVRLHDQNPGFDAGHVLTMQTSLPRPKYASFARRAEFYRDVVERVERLPGVVAAGYTTFLPLASGGGGSLVTIENRPFDPRHMLVANVRVVTPGYFRAIAMTLRRGRLLTADDGAGAPRVVVVNETMAREYWPAEDPLGRRFRRGMPESDGPWWTVVGIVGDMRQGGMDVPVRPEAYFPAEQADFFAPDSLAVRTAGEPRALAPAVQREIWAVDRDQPIASVRALGDIVDENVAGARLEASLLAIFSAVAVLLASLGIYALLTFAVTQRTQEFGVRVALGARRRAVLWMVVREGVAMSAAGLAIGIAAALALSRLMSHLLFDTAPFDPASYGAVAAILAAVTLLASYLPARRAVRVNPITALRYE